MVGWQCTVLVLSTTVQVLQVLERRNALPIRRKVSSNLCERILSPFFQRFAMGAQDQEARAPTENDTLLGDSTKRAKESRTADAIDIIRLAIPIFCSMLSWVGMKTTDSALLGHVSSQSLAAAALSDLWTMCTAVFINAGVLGILVSGAVGADNPKLAGIYLQVSYFVLGCIGVVVMIAWSLTGRIWIAFGSDREVSTMAGYYAKILSLSIPGQIAYGQLRQFFSSQRIMHPEVIASATALFLNLGLGLVLVLGIPIPGFSGFGFVACPIVTMAVEYVQLLMVVLIFVVVQKLHKPAWGGWSWEEITMVRIRRYCDLYVPAAFSSASDFWRVAVIGSVAAQLGETEVAVFNTGYRVMWIVLILVNAMATAAGIKTTTRLGKSDEKGAQQASEMGIALSAGVLLIVGSLAAWKTRLLARLFTNEEEFLDKFEEARLPFCVTLALMNLSVALEKVPFSMGRTKEVFWSGFIGSWAGQVPFSILLTKVWRRDLVGLYTGMAIGYLMLSILYGWMCYKRYVVAHVITAWGTNTVSFSDWKEYSRIARERSEKS